MTGRITVAGARHYQELMFGNAANPFPEYWLALVQAESPDVFVTADELDELETPSYARVSIPNNAGYWTDAATLARTNVEDVVFTPATEDWGMVKHWALCTQDDGGDVFFFGSLASPVDVYALDRLVVPAGAISFGINVLYQGV